MNVEVVDHDLSDRMWEVFGQVVDGGGTLPASVDCETTGLDFEADKLLLCTVLLGEECNLVRYPDRESRRLKVLLGDGKVQKIFHHALFDLRFLAKHTEAVFRNVCCTKVLANLLGYRRGEQSLKSLVKSHLDIDLDKGQRLSDWSVAVLSPEQVEYAVKDVEYLLPLLASLTVEMGKLQDELLKDGSLPATTYTDCCSYLPALALFQTGTLPKVFHY